MARPKADLGAEAADARIKEAFWYILRTGSYEDVTIKRLALEAKVNHKTIYYHYNNVDQMAEALFSELQQDIDLGAIIKSSFEGDSVESYLKSPALQEKMSKALLFARGDSAYLSSIFTKNVIRKWLEYMGIEESDLSDEDSFDLRLIVCGLAGAIGFAQKKGKVNVLQTLPSRELGLKIAEAFRTIAEKYA